jgi:hypothetical protein
MSPMDTLTGPMFDALRKIDQGHITAGDIGVDARVLNALCTHGFLKADRAASQTFYEATPMGFGAIAVLNAPVRPRPSEGPVARIQRVVAEHYRIPFREMTSARRSRDVARPRQVAMYLARELTPFSLPTIGKFFGNRDHTTILYAIRKIGDLDENDPRMSSDINALLGKLEPLRCAA